MLSMAIQENDLVLFCRDNYFKSLKVDGERFFSLLVKTIFSLYKIEGFNFSLKNAIGLPYGTVFAIANGEVQPTTRSAVKKEILDKLVEGNVNFHLKTKYSQEKYITKKKKRYLGIFSIEQPTSRILCELYSRFRPDKVMGIRFDTLCYMLTCTNVHAGSSVLLVETCAGLLLGAVLERLGQPELGGSVIQFYHGTCPPRPDINPYAASVYDRQVCSVSLLDVLSILNGKAATDKPCKDVYRSEESLSPPIKMVRSDCSGAVVAEKASPSPSTLADAAPDEEVVRTSSSSAPGATRRSLRLARKEAAFQRLMGTEATPPDALIVAARFHPVELTLLLLQFLPIGKPFVIFSQFLQPQVELYNALKQRGGIALLQLTDSFYRTIQVLPDRSHPEMVMTGCGGYLLSGFSVEPKMSTDQLLTSGLVHSLLTTQPSSLSSD